MESKDLHIIYFDGICNYCNSIVQFIIRRDKSKKFKFAALQSTYGQLFLKKNNFNSTDFDTIIYQEEDKIYIKSDAALRIAWSLCGGWKYFYYLIYLPKFIRNGIYDLIANNRYRIFGKRESCMLPSEDERARFLE